MQLYGHWRSLASFRVRIALNLKGIAVETHFVDLGKGEQLTDAYRKVNPQLVLPSLIDGEGAPLFQSLAILEYLDETHPQPPLMPHGARARARVRGIAQIAAADAHPLVVPRIRNYLQNELKLDEPTRLKWIRHWMGEGARAIEGHLANEPETGKFCHGDTVTIADICVGAHAAGCRLFEVDMTAYPTFNRIVGECMKMDAFARAHPLKQPDAPAAH